MAFPSKMFALNFMVLTLGSFAHGQESGDRGLLWMRDVTAADQSWTPIGHGYHVVAMAASDGKLFCASKMAIERDLRQSGRTASVDPTRSALARFGPMAIRRGNKTPLGLLLGGPSNLDMFILLYLLDATPFMNPTLT
jgi:hypothetical protein